MCFFFLFYAASSGHCLVNLINPHMRALTSLFATLGSIFLPSSIAQNQRATCMPIKFHIAQLNACQIYVSAKHKSHLMHIVSSAVVEGASTFLDLPILTTRCLSAWCFPDPLLCLSGPRCGSCLQLISKSLSKESVVGISIGFSIINYYYSCMWVAHR